MACSTTDSSLREHGKTEAYILGFHDGRHSGLAEEGNTFEHFIKDEDRFINDPEYQSGWLAGESEGKSLQDKAMAIGNAAAGVYSSPQVSKSTDMDKVAIDALKGVDTTGMESLGK
jgi:hypothetical protein